MKVLLIDHQDSFTYNIVRLLESCGAEVTVEPYSPGLVKKARGYNRILLSPGPGLPRDYPHTLDLLSEVGSGCHVFGICLGLQSLAYYCGADLFRQPEVRHGETVRVTNHRIPGSSLAFAGDDFEVVLYHSWAVDPSTLGPDLVVTAVSEDNVIMGLKHTSRNIEAVQFHPESFRCPEGKTIMNQWLKQ